MGARAFLNYFRICTRHAQNKYIKYAWRLRARAAGWCIFASAILNSPPPPHNFVYFSNLFVYICVCSKFKSKYACYIKNKWWICRQAVLFFNSLSLLLFHCLPSCFSAAAAHSIILYMFSSRICDAPPPPPRRHAVRMNLYLKKRKMNKKTTT